MPYNPNSLKNLTPWQPGCEQPKPGPRYIEKMMERGNQLAPQAISIIGRIMKNQEDAETIPVALRLRAAEFIVDKNWPKPVAGAQVTIEGASSLEVNFHFPGGDTKPNGYATITFDAEGE